MQEERIAISAPVSEDTHEALTVLKANQDATDTVRIAIQRNMRIVAAYPSISPDASSAPNAEQPNLDDILVEIVVDKNDVKTARFDTAGQPNGVYGQSVTLGAYRESTYGHRALNWDLKGTHEILVTFRWKSTNHAAIFPADQLVGIAFDVSYDSNSQNG
jgi:hypothetical protein